MGSSGPREEPYAQDIPPPPDQITGASTVNAKGELEPGRNHGASFDNNFCAVLRDIHHLALLVGIARLHHPRSDMAPAPELALEMSRRDSHPMMISRNH
jgi:hypothetical protein